MPAPTPRRCALTITAICILAVAGFGTWSQASPRHAAAGVAAWTAIGTSGAVGTATLADSASTPGASCTLDRTSAQGFVDVRANGPVVSPAAGLSSRPGRLAGRPHPAHAGRLRNGLGHQYARQPHRHHGSTRLLPRPGLRLASSGATLLRQCRDPLVDPATANLVTGSATYRINFYRPLNEQGTALGQAGNSCRSPEPPSAFIPTPRGTVNTRAGYTLANFPLNTTLTISWDGKQIGTTTTGTDGTLMTTFIVPATPLGYHTVTWKAGTWTASVTYEVVPRIKVIPNSVSRGQQVDISLRGFAKKEVVRIRWKRGGSWIQLGTVLTSNTGSANVFVTVPAWAADGAHSVRGDGPTGRAQTNVVTVQGGTFRPAEEPQTPTATATITLTPTQTATPTPTPPPDASPAAPPDRNPDRTLTPRTDRDLRTGRRHRHHPP